MEGREGKGRGRRGCCVAISLKTKPSTLEGSSLRHRMCVLKGGETFYPTEKPVKLRRQQEICRKFLKQTRFSRLGLPQTQAVRTTGDHSQAELPRRGSDRTRYLEETTVHLSELPSSSFPESPSMPGFGDTAVSEPLLLLLSDP